MKRAVVLLISGLTACTAPSAPTPPDPYLHCREVYLPQRGGIYDRHGAVLVRNGRFYTLVLPRGWPLDSAAFNRALGWPAGALQARVAAARPPVVMLPAPPAAVPDSTRPPLPPVPPPPAFRPQRWPVQLAITAAEAAVVQRQARQWPGLVVRTERRRAFAAPVAAAVLGYRAAEAQSFLYQAKTTERGIYFRLRSGGLESYYNALLTGSRGAYHPLTDGHGRAHGTWAADTLYRPGQALHLGLDQELQAYAERLLGERRGYLVALEPTTGEILCYVSAPTYDPATLTDPRRGAERRALLRHPDRPLLNRPALLANPPGSVFKLVNAAVALQLGAIPADTSFRCDQSLINCVHPHPRARNLTMALKYSCNPYFYQVLRAVVEPRPGTAATAADTCAARYAHLAAWARYVRSFGLDTLLGSDQTRERPGFIPTPRYYDRLYGRCGWPYTTIFPLSIGQGEINITGLQTANVLAIIANRGWYITPHFVRAVGNAGQPLAKFRARHRTLVDSVHLAALVPGMVAALQPGGTAALASLADVGITVAGKTGTVQNDEGEDHATFAGFAPARNPQIVVAVYIENAGFGGLSAAPCAALIMEKYLRGKIAPKRKRWEWWLRCGDLAEQGR